MNEKPIIISIILEADIMANKSVYYIFIYNMY